MLPAAEETYFAISLRHDGPVPGLCSMLILDIAVVGTWQRDRFEAVDAESMTFRLRPIGGKFTSPSRPGLVALRDKLESDGETAGRALARAKEYVRTLAGSSRAVAVVWPGTADGGHVLHYFTHYGSEGSPFQLSTKMSTDELFAQASAVRSAQKLARTAAAQPAAAVRRSPGAVDALDEELAI